MSLIKEVFDLGDSLPKRTDVGVFLSLSEEVGELGKEVAITNGLSYKEADIDGVIGEAIDVIITALDLIHVHKPEFKEKDLKRYARKKMAKWKRKTLAHHNIQAPEVGILKQFENLQGKIHRSVDSSKVLETLEDKEVFISAIIDPPVANDKLKAARRTHSDLL
jgi:NTP pyrophosphatase (non-canonical NTP hydrolase)